MRPLLAQILAVVLVTGLVLATISCSLFAVAVYGGIAPDFDQRIGGAASLPATLPRASAVASERRGVRSTAAAGRGALAAHCAAPGAETG